MFGNYQAPAKTRLDRGIGDGDHEFVDVRMAAVLEPGRRLLEHAEAEILEHRNDVGERDEAALPIDFQTQRIVVVDFEPVKAKEPAD